MAGECVSRFEGGGEQKLSMLIGQVQCKPLYMEVTDTGNMKVN